MKVKVDHVTYLGGLAERRREADDLTLLFDDVGARAKGRLLTVIDVPWSSIESIDVDGPDTIQQRTTVTRLVGLGLFAFAFKKKSKQAFVTIATAHGTGVFEVEKVTPAELTARLGQVLAHARTPRAPIPAASTAPAGWHADPTSRHELRYWDGAQWTAHVSDAGTQAVDPIT